MNTKFMKDLKEINEVATGVDRKAFKAFGVGFVVALGVVASLRVLYKRGQQISDGNLDGCRNCKNRNCPVVDGFGGGFGGAGKCRHDTTPFGGSWNDPCGGRDSCENCENASECKEVFGVDDSVEASKSEENPFEDELFEDADEEEE